MKNPGLILFKTALITLFLFTLLSTEAQVRVGSWRDYLPYTDFKEIVDAGESIYAATEFSIIKIDKQEKSIQRISKLTGLTDSRVSAIGYYPEGNVLLVGYLDGAMDFITPRGIINIADILRANIIADKRINKFTIIGDEAFISCGFGIVRYDLKENEVRETYFIGDNGAYLEVNDVALFNDTLYAASGLGIRKAAFDDPLLDFFGTWEVETNINNSSSAFDLITANENRILSRVVVDPTERDTIYERSGNQWVEVGVLQNQFIRGLTLTDEGLIVSRDGAIVYYSNTWDTLRLETNYGDGRIAQPNACVLDEDQALWIADGDYSVIESPRTFAYEFYRPDGPRTINAERIIFQDEEMLVATGAKDEAWRNTFLIDGIFERSGSGKWSEYSLRFDTALNDVRDYISIASNPNVFDGFVVATLGQGVLEFEDGEYVRQYDTTNSTLISTGGSGSSYVGVTDVGFDNSGNMWCTNTITTSILSAKSVDGQWTRFDFPDILTEETTGDLITLENGDVWVTLPNKGKGIFVLDYNGTLEDKSDDQYTILNASIGSGGLPSSNIYSIAIDREGEVWVGTDQGVGVFFSPTSIFSGSSFDAQRPLVELGGFLQYLLESETVTAIAVDGANRKWLGTSNSGVFLMSEDGTQELLNFTKDNSPLLSNTIKTIAINPNDGEVVISTDRGMIAYRGTATEPDNSFSDVKAFPNPVYEDYSGLIAVSGLANNSRVRITDINGNLVFETYSEGGQAVWNGQRMSGGRVAAGVYLVFALDEDGIESEVTKILVIQ